MGKCHCPPGPPGPQGPQGPSGIVQFACSPITTGAISSTTPTLDLATVTMNVEKTDVVVWLTAYATWMAPNGHPRFFIRFTLVRDKTTEVCVADDAKGGGPRIPMTTALTCCDGPVAKGEHTYTLRATLMSLTGEEGGEGGAGGAGGAGGDETTEEEVTYPFIYGNLTAMQVKTSK